MAIVNTASNYDAQMFLGTGASTSNEILITGGRYAIEMAITGSANVYNLQHQTAQDTSGNVVWTNVFYAITDDAIIVDNKTVTGIYLPQGKYRIFSATVIPVATSASVIFRRIMSA